MDLVNRVSQIWNAFVSDPSMTVAITVSVIVFATLYFFMIKFLVDNKAEAMVVLFSLVMVIGAAILTFAKNINTA